ncbi:hypothetical protein ENHAE0001_1304 [Enhydrobacter aerosaccus SK60]|nr:hypothetical protein ENHAE0001_1304 [Enhydrobacter aerosaccus SK60]
MVKATTGNAIRANFIFYPLLNLMLLNPVPMSFERIGKI